MIVFTCLLIAVLWSFDAANARVFTSNWASLIIKKSERKNDGHKIIPIEPIGGTSSTINNLLRLCGGASESPIKDEKIKGICIGIDLGTTYR